MTDVVPDAHPTEMEELYLLPQVVTAAAILDRETPGWPSYVDPERLNPEDTLDCVLGQLYDNEHPRFATTREELPTAAGYLGASAALRHINLAAYCAFHDNRFRPAWLRLIAARTEATQEA